MSSAVLNNPFMQVALSIVLTIFIAAWMNGRSLDAIGKRIDDLRTDVNADMSTLRADMNSRFGEVNRRLDNIERKIDDHGARITTLEERTSPLARR